MIAESKCQKQSNARPQQDDVTHARSMLEQDSLSKKVTCPQKIRRNKINYNWPKKLETNTNDVQIIF